MNIYYMVIIIMTFIASIAQIMLNISAEKKYKSKIFEYLNPWVISSYALLFIVLLVNSYIMRFIELKNGNALEAFAYVFVLLLSRVILKERLTVKKILGNILIIIGIVVFVWL